MKKRIIPPTSRGDDRGGSSAELSAQDLKRKKITSVEIKNKKLKADLTNEKYIMEIVSGNQTPKSIDDNSNPDSLPPTPGNKIFLNIFIYLLLTFFFVISGKFIELLQTNKDTIRKSMYVPRKFIEPLKTNKDFEDLTNINEQLNKTNIDLLAENTCLKSDLSMVITEKDVIQKQLIKLKKDFQSLLDESRADRRRNLIFQDKLYESEENNVQTVEPTLINNTITSFILNVRYKLHLYNTH